MNEEFVLHSKHFVLVCVLQSKDGEAHSAVTDMDRGDLREDFSSDLRRGIHPTLEELDKMVRAKFPFLKKEAPRDR